MTGASLHDLRVPGLPIVDRLEAGPAALDVGRDRRLLGLVRYGRGGVRPWPAQMPVCSVPLTCLDSPGAVLAWFGCAPAKGGKRGGVVYRCDGTSLFGVYEDRGRAPDEIEGAAYAGHRAMRAAAAGAGYPYIHRIWNYLPEINREIGGLEVYKAFCIGRQRAFELHPPPTDSVVPAACAIGTRIPGYAAHFIAGKRPALALANPRQVEAYHYPPKYGPRSPAFSRAVLVQAGAAAQLHLSGTASIVGHESRHLGDPDRQLTETLINVESLLRRVGTGLGDLGSNARFTVYLRDEVHLDGVARGLSGVLAPEVKRLFLQGDICRSSLLLEIEGIITFDISTLPDAVRTGCNPGVRTSL